jgi:plastocyanin
LVTWNVPAFDGGSPVTAYVVTAAPAGVSLTVAPGTQVSFPGLTNGTSVTFTVVARNAVGDSLPSAPSSAVTPSRVNLRAQITDSPDPVVTDANVTYAVVVTNLEPTAVTNVQLVITRSPDVAGVSVTPSQGSCTGVDVITCNLGTLAGSASATVNVVIRPITPTLTLPASATVSTNVLDADPSDNSATTTTRVNAAPNTTYVAVRDASITPSTTTLSAAGDTVQWNFFGPNVHSATDASGLGLFDTGLVAAVAFSSKVFVAAGTYPYADSGSALTAVVEVPLQLGAGGPNIQVAWASVAAPAGYVYDVQMLTPGAPAYVDWQAGVTMRQKNYNHTATGPGLYKFRARLRQIASGATSGWSPEGAITV